MRIGIDSGGTFTDIVISDANGVRLKKVPSTPDDPARAILQALEDLTANEVVHGTGNQIIASKESELAKESLREALQALHIEEDYSNMGATLKNAILAPQEGYCK